MTVHDRPAQTPDSIYPSRVVGPSSSHDWCLKFEERGWLSCVQWGLNSLYTRFTENPEWDADFLTPEQLQYYCLKDCERGEPSGLFRESIYGTHKSIYHPLPKTADHEIFFRSYA